MFGGGRAEALNPVVFAVGEHRAWRGSAAAGQGACGHPLPAPTLPTFLQSLRAKDWAAHRTPALLALLTLSGEGGVVGAFGAQL